VNKTETRRSMEAFALMREELKAERAIKADLLRALETIRDLPESLTCHSVRMYAIGAIKKARHE
jgi:hypothetical protein